MGRKSGDVNSDDHCAQLFDSDIQDYLNKGKEASVKIFVSTEGTFNGKDSSFSNYEDYLNDCSLVEVKVFTVDELNVEEITSVLCERLNSRRVSVVA